MSSNVRGRVPIEIQNSQNSQNPPVLGVLGVFGGLDAGKLQFRRMALQVPRKTQYARTNTAASRVAWPSARSFQASGTRLEKCELSKGVERTSDTGTAKSVTPKRRTRLQ